MGGSQQIDKLIRKNIILKLRRPVGSCFETMLPLVLFAFLALMRKEYEKQIWFYGPVRFDYNPIFPQTQFLVDIGTGATSLDSLPIGLRRLGGEDMNHSHMHSEQSSMMAQMLSEQFVCNTGFYNKTENLLGKTLSFQPSMLSNRTLAHEIMDLDAKAAASAVREMVFFAKDTDAGEFISMADQALNSYLNSSWSKQMESSSEHADRELSKLRGELRRNDSEAVENRVKAMLHDACHLRGEMFRHLNTSEVAEHLVQLHKALESANVTAMINESLKSLHNVSMLGWFDDYMNRVNNTVLTFRMDEALAKMNASALKTWLLDIRAGMDGVRPAEGWFNKTLESIDQPDIRGWLKNLSDFFNSTNKSMHDKTKKNYSMSFNISLLSEEEARKWLSRIADMLNSKQPGNWFNKTLEQIDSPELRRNLTTWLEAAAKSMNRTQQRMSEGHHHRDNKTKAAEMNEKLERLRSMLNRTGSMLNQTTSMLAGMQPSSSPLGVDLSMNTTKDAIGWMTHFTESGSPLARALSMADDAMDLLQGTPTQRTENPEMNKTLHKLADEYERMRSEYRYNKSKRNYSKDYNQSRNRTMDALNRASRVVSSLADMLREGSGNENMRLSKLVHQAFKEGDFNETLHEMVESAIRKVSRNGTVLDELHKTLRQAEFGGSFAQELLDSLKMVNLSKDLSDEVDKACARINLTNALHGEIRAQTNWSAVLSNDVVKTILEANLSQKLQPQIEEIVNRTNLSESFDATFAEALSQLRSAVTEVDSYFAGLRPSLERLLGNWTDDRIPGGLLQALSNLSGKSAAQVEKELFPRWNESWREECLQVNTSELARHVHAMREHILATEGSNVSGSVKSLHESARTVNMSDLKEYIQKMQKELAAVNVSSLEAAIRDLIQRAQRTSRASKNVSWDMARTLLDSWQDELRSTLNCSENSNTPMSTLMGLLPANIRNMLSPLLGASATPAESSSSGGRGGGGGRRRHGPSSASNYLVNELLRRKILVAPYKGEVKELWDLFIVELVMLFTNVDGGAVSNAIGKELLSSPVTRGALAMTLQTLLKDMTLTFETRREMEKYAMDFPDNVFMAIEFRSADAAGNFGADKLNIEYALRLHAQLMPSTDRVIRYVRFSLFGGVGRQSDPYVDVGYAYIQDTIGRATARLRARRAAVATAPAYRRLQEGRPESRIQINTFANDATAKLRRMTVGTEQYPTPRFKVDMFIYFIQHLLPMLMVMGWIYCISLLVKEMVYEKQERLREVMRIQGLRTWVYWASWIFFAMCELSIMLVIAVFILSSSKVLQYSDPSLIFFFFFVYSGAVVSFAMLISACFNRAKVAAVCAGVVYFSTYLPYSLYNRYEETVSVGVKCLFCLFCPTGMSVGVSIISKWELLEEGIQWSNVASVPMVTNTGALPNNSFNMMHVIAMLFVDMLLYQLAAWYIEKVFPGELGLPQPWYFPFQTSYWRGKEPMMEELAINESGSPEKDDNKRLDCYEAAPGGLGVAVQIRKLVKVFPGGKRAVKGISLDMHHGTILGLLGHNGAGKSTTMSILTGLYPPSEGDVLVHGVSVRKDSAGVRKQLGVCLQHNALYEVMTVKEHLDLFCNLKSVPRKEVPAAVDQLLKDIGLENKRNAFSKALSGGMKRKLSIGIALAGGSRVIALDEPTAGVDATSRRDIWQLLASYKKDRSILLSTHFMDEADVLSDRISVIAEGELTAIGSSIGLKKHFVDRYLLVIVARDNASPSQLLAAVQKVVPSAQSIGTRGREYSYALPSSARAQFAGLFSYLENAEERERLGVETYGLSAPTMEEVFLAASSQHEEGLKGVVRNGAAKTAGDATPPSDTASTASGNTRPNSAEDASRQISKEAAETNSSGSDHTPVAVDQVVEKEASTETPEGLGLAPEQETVAVSAQEEPEPFSPQCMPAALEPQDKVASPTKPKEVTPPPSPGREPVPLESAPLLSGPRLAWQQFRARLWTRAVSAKRDRKAWASQILLPSIFVLLALAVAAILETVEEEPPLKLTSDMFIGQATGGRNDIQEHIMPTAQVNGNAFSAEIVRAFQAAKRPADRLVQIPEQPGVKDDEALREYIMANKQDLRSKSYGALNVAMQGDVANVTLFYDSRGAHITPALLHMCNNARLKLLGYEDTYTEAWNHPLPMTAQLIEEQLTSNNQVFTSLTVAITVLLAMGFIPASFVVYIVHEKATNAKHQQLLTGVSPVMYWVSTYAWDLVNYFLPVLFIWCLFLIFQLDAYSGRNAAAVLVVLLSYGLSMTPQMYCIEPFFSVPSTAYVVCIVSNIFTGFVSLQITTVLQLLEGDMPHLKGMREFLESIFMWTLPNYCLGRSFVDIATNHYIRYAAEEFGACWNPDVCAKDGLDWSVSGRWVFALWVTAGMWFGVRLLVEWRCFLRFCLSGREAVGPKSGLEDEDVLAEAQRVNEGMQQGKSNGSLVVQNLSKTFKRKAGGCCCCCRRRRTETVHSVRGINMAVSGGECFGLLGVNGAGKTTTMRMITGDIEVGGGDVQLANWSVKTHRDQARRHLGYCPQFDALTDKLTTREALRFYAKIRGVDPRQIEAVVEAMVKRMCLEAHQNRLCQHLSGGNKRKLSTALALIGEPDVVLLDEPSTGVDVGARRFLWEVIGGVRLHGHAVVLTSHSMDECEVLCTRLTIMVSGEMRCLGTPMQLKAKYGGGYTLAVKARQAQKEESLNAEESRPWQDPSGSIRGFMETEIPAARLAEENVGLFRYRLGGNEDGKVQESNAMADVKLADLFSSLEGAMASNGSLENCVLDYTVSQTSLEEVFLYFSQL